MTDFPRLFFGTHAQVAGRCRRLLPRLERGDALCETVGLVDIPAESGKHLIVTTGPSAPLSQEAHLHVFLLHSLLYDASLAGRVGRDTEARVFDESLSTFWGTLALNAQHNQSLFFDRSRDIKIVDATAREWSKIDGLGNVFAGRFLPARPFLQSRPTVLFALRNLGVDEEAIFGAWPSGLPGLLKTVGWKYGQGIST